MVGAKNAISRYSKLKDVFDSDLLNNNWLEVCTRSIAASGEHIFIDLFSGAGGLSLGFCQAGFNKVASIEVNRYASETIRHNFPNSTHFEKPIEDLSREDLLQIIGNKTVDVVCGGPPCNGFSVAGSRRIDDPRNKLFLEFARVVEIVKPKYVLMENVPGILTMQGGAVYRAILDRFAEIGYPDMSVRILEAAEFGVPQLRTRAIFVGNRFGRANPYPKPILTRAQYASIEIIDDLKDLPRNEETNHEWTAHSKEYEKRIAQVLPGGSLYDTYRDAFKRQYRGVPSMAIKENHGGTHIHYEKNRVLSAREMARLQTFPDNFYFCGGMKKAYWQIGNAVPCELARHLALAIESGLRGDNTMGVNIASLPQEVFA